MKIVVLMKVTPDTETRFQLNAEATDVVWDASIEYIIGPYDEYAVEEAIKIKENLGGEVILVTIGSGNEEKSIRKAMAMGADSGIHINSAELMNSDPLSIARAIAETIKPLQPDLIFTGKVATDTSDSFVGPAVADILNMPVIAEISELEVTADRVVATRDVGGRKEKFESAIPVVLTANKGLNEPRYPKLPMIMKAKKKPLEKLEASPVPVRNVIQQVKVEFPPTKEAGSKIVGTPDELVSQLMDGLVNRDKVI
jgi:electron transfer flavoprotein beta subunit